MQLNKPHKAGAGRRQRLEDRHAMPCETIELAAMTRYTHLR